MNDERCTKDSRTSGDDIVISRARGHVLCERTPVEVDLPGSLTAPGFTRGFNMGPSLIELLWGLQSSDD
jgi:hypothetical protein